MKIYKKISKFNNSSRSGQPIRYIVIHYVGAVSSAKNNAIYFANGNRNASAHFFVDRKEVWQSVLESRSAWHCGGGLQGSKGHRFHGSCKNSNAIGVELCCERQNGKLVIPLETLWLASILVQHLMRKYGIPASHVIRHFDVTGKSCPEPFCGTELKDRKWLKEVKPLLTGAKKRKVGKNEGR